MLLGHLVHAHHHPRRVRRHHGPTRTGGGQQAGARLAPRMGGQGFARKLGACCVLIIRRLSIQLVCNVSSCMLGRVCNFMVCFQCPECYGARSTSDIKACTRTFLRRHNAGHSSRYVVSSMSGKQETTEGRVQKTTGVTATMMTQNRH